MPLFSIGHSNANIDVFLGLLRQHHIDLLVDARSNPYSRYNPHFNREPLHQSLRECGIEYVFLGNRIGGKPEAEALYFQTGKVDYARLAETTFFLAGIERLIEWGQTRRIAFMCAEADYKHCHRYWLITRALVRRGIEVQHILHSGEVVKSETAEFESRQPGLF